MKYLFFAVMLFSAGLLFAEPIYQFMFIDYDETNNIYILPDKIVVIDAYASSYKEIPRSNYYLGKDGYNRLIYHEPYFDDIYGKITEYIAIEGVLVLQSKIIADKYVYHEYDWWHRPDDKISSSKHLTEKTKNGTVEYKPENLLTQFAFTDDKERPFEFNPTSLPWVEGEDGPGIGANITISFKWSTSELYILNGYVDVRNTHLYLQNNRVKKIKVIDLDNNTEYEQIIPDYVHFEQIKLKKQTKNVKLVIEEVYKGTKFDDTCITAIETSLYHTEYTDTSNSRYLEWINEAKINSEKNAAYNWMDER